MAIKRVRVVYDINEDPVERQLELWSEIGHEIGATEQEVSQLSGQYRAQSRQLGKLRGDLKSLRTASISAHDSGRVRQLNRELRTTSGEIDRVTNRAKASGSTLKNLASQLGPALGVTAIAALGKQAVEEAAKFEQTAISFETFLGSAEAAQEAMAKLEQFSVATPFTPEQVLEAGRALLAFGEPVDNLETSLSQIGDIAAATGKDFNELATIYGKARVAGTLFAEDINQLTEAGVPIIQQFADQLKVGTDKVKKLASEGKIGFDELQKAFAAMTGEGGRFEGLTKKLSQSTAGLLSTLQGNLQKVLRDIGTALLPAVNAVVTAIQEGLPQIIAIFTPLRDSLSTIFESFNRISEAIGGVSKEGNAASGVVNVLVKAFEWVQMPVTLAYEAVAFLVQGFANLVDAVPFLRNALASVVDVVQTVSGAISRAGGIVRGFLYGLEDGPNLIQQFAERFGTLENGLKSIVGELGGTKKQVRDFVAAFNTEANRVQLASFKNLDDAIGFVKQSFVEMYPPAKTAAGGISDAGKEAEKAAAAKRKLIEEMQTINQEWSTAAERVDFWSGRLRNAEAALINGTGTIQSYNTALSQLNQAQATFAQSLATSFDAKADLDNAMRDPEPMEEFLENYLAMQDEINGGDDGLTFWDRLGFDEEGVQTALGFAEQFASTFSAIMQAQKAKQLADISEAQRAEIQAVQNSVQNEEERARQIEAIDEKYRARKEAAEKEFAQQEQRLAIFQAVINTAAAVTKTLASVPFPANVLLASLVGAQGAAQIALIKAQQFAEGGPVTGGQPNKDSVPAMLMPGEFVITKDVYSKNRDLIHALHDGRRPILDQLIMPGPTFATVPTFDPRLHDEIKGLRRDMRRQAQNQLRGDWLIEAMSTRIGKTTYLNRKYSVGRGRA